MFSFFLALSLCHQTLTAVLILRFIRGLGLGRGENGSGLRDTHFECQNISAGWWNKNVFIVKSGSTVNVSLLPGHFSCSLDLLDRQSQTGDYALVYFVMHFIAGKPFS